MLTNTFFVDPSGHIIQLDDMLAMGIIPNHTPGPQPKPEPEPEPSPEPEPAPEPSPEPEPSPDPQPIQESYVEIGGREYRTTVIGNLEWLAEDLDYAWDGLPVGTEGKCYTVPRATYYNDDQETYGNYGLMYNWYAAKYLDDNKDTLLPAGWRLPTHEDMLALAEIVGLDDNDKFAGYKLKSINGWNSQTSDGTDEFGFTLLPGGMAFPYPSESDTVDYRDVGSVVYLWQRDEYEAYPDNAYELSISRGVNEWDDKRSYNYLRLVRDAT